MGQNLIEPTTIEQLFQEAPFIGEPQAFILSVEMLHHLYLQMKLSPNEAAPEVDLELLANGAYYLSAVATTQQRKASLEKRQLLVDALSVAAMIFEYLGDLTDEEEEYRDRLEDSELYYLDACICNTLSIYESNSMTIARRRLMSAGTIGEVLNTFETGGIVKLCQSIAYTWLGRDFRRIWWNERRIIDTISTDVQEMERRWTEGTVSTTAWHTTNLWATIGRALLAHARFFQFGEESLIDRANEALASAKRLAEHPSNLDHYWTVSALQECADRMYRNSVWKLLEGKLPQRYIRSLVTGSQPIYELWTSQREALEAGQDPEVEQDLGVENDQDKKIKDGYLDDRVRRVLVSMPTSAGKSLVAEMAIVRTLFPERDTEDLTSNATCIYVVPSIALVNEVERRLNGRLLPLGVRATAILGGYDATLFDTHLFSQTRVAVLTPEKLSLFLRQDEPFVLSCRLFIFDEVHKVDDLGRGWTLEEVITWLKDFHPDTRSAKMIFMSAVISNRLQLELWLAQSDGANVLRPIMPIDEPWQPTRQLKAICEFDEGDEVEEEIGRTPRGRKFRTRWIWGHLTYYRDRNDIQSPKRIRRIIRTKQTEREVYHRRRERQRVTWEKDRERSYSEVDNAVQLASRFVEAKLDPVLVFFMKRDQTSAFCQKLLEASTFGPPELSPDNRRLLDEMCTYIGDRLGPEFPLVEYLPKGVAFHHGQLPRDVRAEIEYAFRRGWIRVIASTTTLAEGVNFPIATFILANHRIHIGKNREWALEKKDFRNMIGRAGRAVYDTEGQIIFMLPYASSSQDWREYLFPDEEKDPEQWVLSSFVRPDFRSDLLELWLNLNVQDDLAFLNDVDPDQWGRDLREAKDVAKSILRLQAFLLVMIDKEIIDPANLETFLTFFQRTLLGQQSAIAPERQNLLARFCLRTAQAIVNQEPDPQRRKVYSKGGLAFQASRTLFEFSQNFWRETGRSVYNQQIEHLTAEFLSALGNLIFSLKETKPDRVRSGRAFNTRKIDISHEQVFVDWVLNEFDIKRIRRKYFGTIADSLWSSEACVHYIYDAFEYKAPWAISAFNFFVKSAAEQSGIESFETTELGFQLSMLPAYAKFGVCSPAAAFFSSLGIGSKEVAKLLSQAYSEQHRGQEKDFSTMLRWFLSVEPEELTSWYRERIGEDTSGQISRVFRIIRSLKITEFDLRRRLPISLYVAGWYFYQGEQIFNTLRVGQILVLEPEPDNPHDPYAVRVLTQDGIQLGYIPMTHSAGISRLLMSGEALSSRIIETNPPPAPSKQRVKVKIGLE